MNQTLIKYNILYFNPINLLSYIKNYETYYNNTYIEVFIKDNFWFCYVPHLIPKETYEND